MTTIRAELQTTDFLFLCRSSLLLSEICQNIHMKFDAQIAANGVSGSIYFKNFPGEACPRTTLASLTPSALVCMTMPLTRRQPRKPGSFTCARAPANTLVPSGHVNPQILGVIRIAASLPLREEW